jgi:phosphoribosylanthranilate isomerase
MGLKTVVKVSHVSDLAVARYCSGMGVNMIGFCLDRHFPAFLEAKQAQEIAGWVAGVQVVGEISASIAVNIEDYPLSMLEVGTSALLRQFADAPMIYRFSVDNVETLAFCSEALTEYQPYVTYFLLESTLLTIDKQTSALLAKLCTTYPILIGFGVNKDNITTILEEIKPTGVALKGNLDELAEILEQIEIEDNL